MYDVFLISLIRVFFLFLNPYRSDYPAIFLSIFVDNAQFHSGCFLKTLWRFSSRNTMHQLTKCYPKKVSKIFCPLTLPFYFPRYVLCGALYNIRIHLYQNIDIDLVFSHNGTSVHQLLKQKVFFEFTLLSTLFSTSHVSHITSS